MIIFPKHRKFFYFIVLLTYIFLSSKVFADSVSDPCAGPSALLNLPNRPTKSDSPCVVKFDQAMLEVGYLYLNLIGGASGQNYPEAQIRLGLPYQNEFAIFLPNYNLQSVSPRSGYDPTVISVKHEIGYNAHWLGAIEGVLLLPTGGGGFGSDKYDPIVNGIIEYSFNSALTLTLMLGIGSQSLSPLAGGERYTTINPDLVLTWQMNDKAEIYGEIFGQSRTGPNQGAAYVMNAGILYLLTRKLEVDAAIGRRMSGKLDGVNNFYGVGMSILFD